MALNKEDDCMDDTPNPQVNAATVPLDSVVQLTQLVADLQQEVKKLKAKDAPTIPRNCNPKTGKHVQEPHERQQSALPTCF